MTDRTGPQSLAVDADPFLRGLVGGVALLLAARAVERLFFGEAFYTTLSIHPFWIVVILVAVQNGFFVGVATAAAAAMLMDWPARPIGVDITTHYVELAILPVQWLLAAIIIGSFRQGQIRREARLAAENARLRQTSEDLAAELERMDGEVATLELHAATTGVGGAGADACFDDGGATASGYAGAPQPALSALSALAMTRPGDFEARFAEAAAALGFAGAAFHVRMCAPVRAGTAPEQTVQEAEKLHRLVSKARIVEISTSGGIQTAVGVGENGLVTTLAPRREQGPGETVEDSLVHRGKARPAPADGASAMPAAEAIGRTALLAAAVHLSGFRPAANLAWAAGAGTARSARWIA